MKKATVAALALTTIVAIGAGIAIAQQTQGPPRDQPGMGMGPGMGAGMGDHGPGGMMGRRQPPSPEVMQRMLDGKIAGTKAALRLTAEQERLWPAVEQAVRDGAAKRMKMREEMRGRFEQMRKDGKKPDMLEMIDRMSERSGQASADLKKFAETIRPLYATLSDEQKQVLAASLRPKWAGEHQRGGMMGRWFGRG